jgi:hypothetical protein
MRWLPTRPSTSAFGEVASCPGNPWTSSSSSPSPTADDAFGSAIVSSVSTFGAERAYGPLNPWYRVPVLVLVSEVKQGAVVVDGEIVARPMLTLAATLDHRYLDGAHAGRLVRSARAYLEDPSAFESATREEEL